MTPTNELRFVERVNNHRDTIRVLQQKWVQVLIDEKDSKMTRYEWRDVPLVKEVLHGSV